MEAMKTKTTIPASRLKLHASLLLFALCSMPYAHGQQYGWTDLSANVPGDPDFSGVFFVSDNEGWMSVSSGPEIYHTTDGGATFEIQETSLGTSTSDIYMIDENEGYTGGGSGFVYRTTNGGINWDLLGAMSSTLAELDFANSTQGYACGDNGAVFSITPQGVTNLNSGLASDLAGVSAPSVDNVWICGGGQIVHFNGSDFNFQSGPVGSYNSIFFINDLEGWVIGTGGIIGHTENSGVAWANQAPGNPSDESLFDIFFLTTEIGWAVGARGTILKTTNGGDTWFVEGAGLTTALLRRIHFTSPTNGYVVGNGKTLLKYSEVSGIGDLNHNGGDIMLWPNPTQGQLKVQSSKCKVEFKSLDLIDLYGKVLITHNNRTIEQWNSGTLELDLSGFPPGIYIVRIIFGNELIVKKIIKL
jgi:photosystem II stability/assembly factor-like uncharacterized protein